jgi:hypothetical protein
MAMVGHEKKKVSEPETLLMTELDGFQQGTSGFFVGELGQTLLLAANRNKPDATRGVDPEGRSVWKRAPADFHGAVRGVSADEEKPNF